MKSLIKKLILPMLSLTLLFTTNVMAANHTHTSDCYGVQPHICAGNSTTYGACYSEKVVTYHTHTGVPNQTIANGCYTQANITYHTHNDQCYTTTPKECTHNNIAVGTTNSLMIMDYYTCPNCNQDDFFGYKYDYTLSCNNENITLYAGECDNCNYKGNATLERMIQDNSPAILSYKHSINEKVLSCNKTETTQETIVYELGCGKTTSSIENTTYLKTCTKTIGGYYNSKGEKITPTCNSVIVSIRPKTATQTTFNPDFTLVATYLDGHIAEIQPTTAAYNSSKTYNNSTITLTYTGMVTKAGNKSSLSTTIKLTTPTTPTPTPTSTPTPTITPTSTPTSTPTVTTTPTITSTPTPMITSTPTISIVEDDKLDIDGSFVLEGETQVEESKENEPLKENTIDLLELENEKEEINSNETINDIEEQQEIKKETNSGKTKTIIFLIFTLLFTMFVLITAIIFCKVNQNKKNENSENDENDDDYFDIEPPKF